MEFIAGRPVPHCRLEPPVPRCHSKRLLSEDAGLTSNSAGELAMTAFLLHGRLTNLFSHLSIGDHPKPKPGASRLPPRAGPAIRCQSTPPSVLLFDLLGGMARRWRDSSSHHHEQADNDCDSSCVGQSATTTDSFDPMVTAPRCRAWIWAQRA
jgi:hypothetical protein